MSVLEASVPAKTRMKRTPGGANLGQGSSRDAKRVAAAILEVLAGQRTPTQAAQAISVSVPRYYQLEAYGLRGLLAACEPKPRGRQVNLSADLAALRQQNERLQRDLMRQQSLVRLTQRVTGLSAPVPAPAKDGKKTRKRKPAARALTVADRLRQDLDQPSENGTSVATE
jgi:hypothetical protein